MNLLETYIEEIHSEHERKTDFCYVVDADITENCYGGITRKKKTFLKDEWADIKKERILLVVMVWKNRRADND